MEAGSDARYLSDLIRRMTGAPAYLDSTDLVDLRLLFQVTAAPSGLERTVRGQLEQLIRVQAAQPSP